eukprot:scaffold8150_cov72-Phaeocystis_antarctica.AAC.13
MPVFGAPGNLLPIDARWPHHRVAGRWRRSVDPVGPCWPTCKRTVTVLMRIVLARLDCLVKYL